MNCPGSVKAQEGLPDTVHVIADEGTILHSFTEDAIRNGFDVWQYNGQTREYGKAVVSLNDELCEMIQKAVDLIWALDGDISVEKKVDLGKWLVGQFGTLDIGVAGKNKIIIWDHKFGYVPVSPVRNKQLLTYAAAFWWNVARHITDTMEFELVIFQPRASGGGGSWSCTLADVLDHADEMVEMGNLALSDNPPRIPGRVQCEYCRAAIHRTCPEFDKWEVESLFGEGEYEAFLAGEPTDPIVLPEIPEMTYDALTRLVLNKGMIEAYLNRAYETLLDIDRAGGVVEGMKRVMSSGGREYFMVNEVVHGYLARHEERLLKETGGIPVFKKTPLTPTQLRKILPEKDMKFLNGLTYRTEPTELLVPDTDPRKAQVSYADTFEPINDEDLE